VKSHGGIGLALCVAAAAVGCAPRGADSPRDKAPGAALATGPCGRVMDQVTRFEEVLTLSTQEESQRNSLASALRMMRRFDRGSAELSAGLDGIVISDRALSARVVAYAAAARELGEGAEAGVAMVELVASKIAQPLADAKDAERELDRACVTTDADCKALQTALVGSGGAAGWDVGPAVLEKARVSILGVHPRRAKVALAQEHVARAIDGLTAIMAELDHVSDGPKQVLDKAGAATKKAGEGLRELCPNATVGGADEWVTAAKQDMRALTVIVSFKPPGNLTGAFERAAKTAPGDGESFFRAAAAGGFGSGFVVVRHTEKGPGVFIVTNRHVVEMADHVVVTRTDGTAFRARIVYSDPHYDLAVLALDGDDPGFDHGFDLETSGAHDEQAVTATGFPGLDHRPSYQVTKGYVSNDRFELDMGGLKLAYIQHTAPIDRGSSGGPLMNDAGKVLGVNTLKAFGREGVAFAAPSAAVVGAVRYAASLDSRLGSAAFRKQTLRDDCLDLVAELRQDKPRPWRLAQLVSTRMVADQGVESLNLLVDQDKDLKKYWQEDPVDAVRFAIAMRLRDSVLASGGVGATETCATPNRSDMDQILTSDRVRIPIQLGTETRELVMRWEQGRWKLAHVDFPAAQAPGKAKATKASKTAPRAKS
jgi:serine protease Do